MADECVVAVYQNYEKAHVGLQVLDLRGFDADSVSVISGSDQEEIAKREHLRRLQRTSGPANQEQKTRAAYFTLVTAQTLLGIVLGPVLLVGPIAALIVGSGVAAVRSISAAISPRIPESMGRTYEQFLHDGCVLVIVYGSDDELADAASGLQTTDTLSLQTH